MQIFNIWSAHKSAVDEVRGNLSLLFTLVLKVNCRLEGRTGWGHGAGGSTELSSVHLFVQFVWMEFGVVLLPNQWRSWEEMTT